MYITTTMPARTPGGEVLTAAIVEEKVEHYISLSDELEILVPVDNESIIAGGPTIMELVLETVLGNNFPTVSAAFKNYYWTVTHYELETRIATICDDKDNYRFGFNGQEKDNEVKGIDNSLISAQGSMIAD